MSDESGRAEVYVRPFPAVDQARWPISIAGGSEPRWAPNGRELFYTVRSGGYTAPGVLMSVPADGGRFLFHLTGRSFSAPPPTGESRPAGDEPPRHEIIVVQNCFEELKARVPTGAVK